MKKKNKILDIIGTYDNAIENIRMINECWVKALADFLNDELKRQVEDVKQTK